MAKATFLKIITYLESLAKKHVDIKTSFRWNVTEVQGAMRSGIGLPFMAIDPVETKPKGGLPKPVIDNNTIAFTVLGKEGVDTSNIDDSVSQNEVLDYCQEICLEIRAKILTDVDAPKDAEGNKNWLYGMVDEDSFHFYKVGPLYTEHLYGFRCELTIKTKPCIAVDPDKWIS